MLASKTFLHWLAIIGGASFALSTTLPDCPGCHDKTNLRPVLSTVTVKGEPWDGCSVMHGQYSFDFGPFLVDKCVMDGSHSGLNRNQTGPMLVTTRDRLFLGFWHCRRCHTQIGSSFFMVERQSTSAVTHDSENAIAELTAGRMFMRSKADGKWLQFF